MVFNPLFCKEVLYIIILKTKNQILIYNKIFIIIILNNWNYNYIFTCIFYKNYEYYSWFEIFIVWETYYLEKLS